MDEGSERLRRATSELIDAALRLAAYGAGCVNTGAGQRDTMRNMVDDVETKADAARSALRATS